jgi:capsular polysaccharide biosynthesis protein
VTGPVFFSLDDDNGEPDRLGVYDDFAGTENRSADFAPGLVSLGFIKAAMRRSARFLFVMTIVGMLAGFGAYVKSPHSYQASASVLLTLSPYENGLTAVADNQAVAKTTAVAGLAVHKLGLPQQDVSSFLNTYTATSVTDRLLTVTASAPSISQAALRASAVGNAFLKFRADEQHAQENLVLQSLDQQVNQAKQRVNSIDAQISQLPSQPTSPTQQSQLARLRLEQTSATATLSNFQEAINGNQTGTQPALTAALDNSQVLSVTPVPYSKKKKLITYGAIGLIVGLALGLTIVIVRALVSDRLRRRDDIAYALDAPVRLSVSTLGARRTLMPRPGRTAKRDLDMKRVVAHLHSAVPRSTQGPASLAIVAIDNAPVVARAVAALATSYASHGTRVVTADLSSGAYLAHLSGVKGPGIQTVSHNSVNFMMAVPDRSDPAPIGPLPPVTSPTGPAQAGDALVASDVSADLLLTLVTLDPALGGDHLATWATNAVVVVSAGRSSAERIHGVGEMIRLAGMRLDSAVVIGADKGDESLGLVRRSDEQAGVGVLGR